MARLLFLLLAAPLCHAAAPPQLPVVVAVPPQVETFAPSRAFTGKVEAPESATIRPRAGGQVSKVFVKEGQLVKKDQVLFQLDDAVLRAELTRAEARAQSAKAGLERAKADLARARRLMVGGGISREEFDSLTAQAVKLLAGTKLAEAEVVLGKIKFEMAQVRSPIEGRAGRVLVRVGDAVRENETALVDIEGVGKPVVVLEVKERDYLDVFLPLATRPAMDEARKARVTTATRKQFPGRVVSIEGRLHPTTGTARVSVSVEGEDISLVPGFSAKVEVLTGKPAPETFSPAMPRIMRSGTHRLLVVDAANTIRHRPVQIGLNQGSRTCVLSGLKKGDRVLLDQYHNPRRKAPAEGTRVRVAPPPKR